MYWVLSGIDDTAACGRKPQAVARTGITHLTLVIWVGIKLGLVGWVGITVALVGNVGIKLCPSWFAPEQKHTSYVPMWGKRKARNIN